MVKTRRKSSTSNLVQSGSAANGHGMGNGKIKFGDKPSTKTVNGRRIAAVRAAEERRFEQLVRERIEEEFDSRWRRLMRHVVGFLSH